MTPKEKREALKAHPDTVTIHFAGEDRRWMLGKYAFDLVRKSGMEVEDVIGGAATEEEIMAQGIGENLDMVARMLWAGLLPFDPDLELEWVELMLSMKEMNKIREVLNGALEVDSESPAPKKKD